MTPRATTDLWKQLDRYKEAVLNKKNVDTLQLLKKSLLKELSQIPEYNNPETTFYFYCQYTDIDVRYFYFDLEKICEQLRRYKEAVLNNKDFNELTSLKDSLSEELSQMPGYNHPTAALYFRYQCQDIEAMYSTSEHPDIH
ncbi:MAG: hypothetical protein WC823_03345 [Parcubacteria group bacterium]|jgi:hypothetical protein